LKVIDVPQLSPEWMELRRTKIGASDVSTILGLSPFGGTAFGLFLEKTGQKRPWAGNEATNHGHDNEDTARLAYAAEVGDAVVPLVCVCDVPGFEFLMCSLDGWRAEGVVVEIKAPIEAGTFREAKEGHIDEHYLVQVYAQLFVTGAKRCDFTVWFRGEHVIIPVEFQPEYWALDVAPQLQEFWRRVQEKSWPHPEGEVKLDTEEFRAWAVKMGHVIALERETADRKRKLIARGQREFFGNYALIEGGGLEIKRTYKNGYTEARPRTVAPQISTTIRRTE
jgi:putative phage-type endonuclease